MNALTRTIVALPLVLTPTSAALAQSYGGGGEGAFALQRWEEDYSHLKQPSGERSFFDAIKYVPLNESGDAYLSFGGQARYRYDYFNNFSFGPGINDEDGFHLGRYLAHVDAHLGKNLRAFVQLNGATVDGREGGGRYGDADDLDVQQAFVDVMTSGDANPYAYLRLGRQELTYGAERYISPDDWRNVRRTFDGVKLSVSVPNDTIDVFAARPVDIERDEPNAADPSTFFGGVYNVLALSGVYSGAGTKLENYFLILNQTEESSPPTVGVDANTYTVGARFYTHPGAVDFDLEGTYQFGNVAGERLSAWSIATEAGYTFESMRYTPRAYVGLDVASGSPEPDGRFNQLFPPTYTYLGHLYLFGRPNVIDVHGGINFHLSSQVTLFTTHHVYWRQNTNDGLINLSGGGVRGDNGSDASYIGNEFDVVINWQFNRYLGAYLGYAHFFPGDFLAETGPSKDVDFLYAAVTFTF
jgi:hypothetical protein